MKLTYTNYFIILEKTIFKRAHQKSKYLCSGSPRRHILGCGVSFPPEFQLAFHIYYVKYENTLTCKRISWNSGGGGGGGDDVLKIFFYFQYV